MLRKMYRKCTPESESYLESETDQEIEKEKESKSESELESKSESKIWLTKKMKGGLKCIEVYFQFEV